MVWWMVLKLAHSVSKSILQVLKMLLLLDEMIVLVNLGIARVLFVFLTLSLLLFL